MIRVKDVLWDYNDKGLYIEETTGKGITFMLIAIECQIPIKLVIYAMIVGVIMMLAAVIVEIVPG